MIKVEATGIKDLASIHRMEVLGQEFPFDSGLISTYLMGEGRKFAYVATISSRPVGSILGHADRDDPNDVGIVIDHLTVHPLFRNNGVSRKLLKRLNDDSRKIDIAKDGAHLKVRAMRLLVPSYLVDDKDDPLNIENWLWKMGFKAISSGDHGCFRYCKNWESYVFEKLIDVETP